MIPFTHSKNKETNVSRITFHFGGKQRFIDSLHGHYTAIAAAISAAVHNPELIASLLEPTTHAVKAADKGRGLVTCEGGVVKYKGTAVHSTLADRIVAMIKEGFSVDHMLVFLENLMLNPSMRSVNELYDFLSNAGLAITEDGHFLAYKGVNANFTDCHSGTFDNSPGKVHEIERNQVDDDRENQCSFGFHVGAHSYAVSFGPKLMLVKVNPKDAVAVPKDHSCQKLRVCRYEVLKEFDGETALKAQVYSPAAEVIAPDLGTSIADSFEEKLTRKEHLNLLLQQTRDEVIAAAVVAGVIKNREAGRTLGKTKVCKKLAAHLAK